MHDERVDHLATIGRYFKLMNLNGASRVYRVALEIGLLDALANAPAPLAELAERLAVQPRPLALVLDVLQTLGLAQCADDDAFAATALAKMLLGSDYRQLGDHYWDHLPDLLRSGQPLVRLGGGDGTQTERFYQAQAAALGWMLRPAAEAAAELLHPRVRGGRILDVGAGSAVWSLALARRDAQARVTAVDWQAVLEVARQSAQQAGLLDRFDVIPGDFHEVELPSDQFDLAILGNVTHLQTPEGNVALFERLKSALKTGGAIVIFDVFPGDERGDLNRALYALGLALRTDRGRVHAREELREQLHQAGFDAGEAGVLPVPPYAVGMLLAKAR